MLVSIVACATSDSNKPAEETTDKTNDTIETTESGPKPDVPNKNYNGIAFTFMTRGEDWFTVDVFAESQNGEPLNDAVWQRNSVVEEKFNISIAEIKKSGYSLNVELEKAVNADERIYDACIMSGANTSISAQSKFLLDLTNVPYIELSNPWWDQNANRDFFIGGKLYFTCCDLSISDKDGSWATGFNKRLVEDYKLDNPYDLVKNNQWTMDKMYEMGKAVSADLDGDGVMTAADMWGIAAERFDTYALFFAGGERVFKNNSEGYPELVVYNDRSPGVIEKYMRMVQDTDLYHIANVVYESPFNEGRALFYATTLLTIRRDWRAFDDDFGIIPGPKYDSKQDNYALIVSIGGSASVQSIPIIAPDPEMSGILLEYLAYESSRTLIPTYYEICFNSKYLRDNESIEMLKLCIESRVFDLSIIYDWGGWCMWLFNFDAKSTFDLASHYEANKEKTLLEMEKTLEAFK